MAEYVQTQYSINPEVGFVGDIARPNEPFALDSGILSVPAGATAALSEPTPVHGRLLGYRYQHLPGAGDGG